ncbi:MAG: helix-turn-helix domain-containing protein [Thermomicrobiales bacterium]
MTTPQPARDSEIGKQLEQTRKSLNWSLRDAQRESGVSNSYISQIERGDVDPSPEVLRRLGQAYGVPFEVLMEAAGYLIKRTELKESGKVPAFVFSAAEKMDERDWEAAQAFFQTLLKIRKKDGDQTP